MPIRKRKPKEPKFKFNLGDEVEDTIAGFTGIVVARTQWLYNCNTYGVRSTKLKDDGSTHDDKFFDEPQLKIVKKEVKKPKNKTGGPVTAIPQTNR